MVPIFDSGGAGDKDFKQIVKEAIESVSQDVEIKIDSKNGFHSAVIEGALVLNNCLI